MILEVFLILLLGNLVSALNWFLNIPINTGILNVFIAIIIYTYVIFKYKFLIRQFNFKQLKKFNFKSFILVISLGLSLAIIPVLFFKFPILVSNIDYSPIKNLAFSALLFRLFIEIPLFTALSEELLFRQYIWSKFKNFSHIKMIIINAIIFTLWHLVVACRTVLDTSFSQNILLLVISYLGALISIFVGGAVFCYVRYKTGSFWYAAITHWLNVAVMTLAIWTL